MVSLSLILVPGAILVTLIVLALLSQRLGAVTRRPPHYRWLYVSAALVVAGAGLRGWAIIATGAITAEAALLYDIPMVIGLLIAVFTVWRYWSWLIYEQDIEDR